MTWLFCLQLTTPVSTAQSYRPLRRQLYQHTILASSQRQIRQVRVTGVMNLHCFFALTVITSIGKLGNTSCFTGRMLRKPVRVKSFERKKKKKKEKKFLVITRRFLVYLRKYLVISKRFLVITRSFLVYSRNYLVISKRFLVITRWFLVYSRKYLVISKRFLVIT